MAKPQVFDSLEAAVDFMLARIDGPLRLGAPLGIGKPHRLLNALYARMAPDPSRSLHLYTALSLDPPSARKGLEARFLGPFVSRHFGGDFVRLAYVQAQKADALPAHIEVEEFYLQSGALLHSSQAQRRYASLLRWTLEHRGKSILGILLIIAVSIVPMTQTKFDMFGQEGGDEANIFYQWKGAYTKEQMSDEIRKIEAFLNTNRKRFHIKQIYSYYSEQGWGGTKLTFDTTDTKQLVEQLRKDMPKSARAELGIGDQGGPGGGGGAPGQKIQVQLVGDSSQTLAKIGEAVVPVLARRKELRDVRIDTGVGSGATSPVAYVACPAG